ncbi:MAG: autotransporter-associated beta strand repeat-containing protein [Verrucomicrobia bacterium]|nr:autotransporter-associated beta strand repeat-containing protein [Verrucomicrobiota bacterium]
MNSSSILRLSFPLAAAIAALLAAPSAIAATYYWDNNGTTAGYGTASGTWTVPTVSQWSTSNVGTAAPGASITTVTTDALNFGNGATGLGAGTITVTGSVSSGNMTFASGSGAIILSGGTINFWTTPVITVNNASDTVGSVLAGAATSLTKAGTGTLLLSAANTYTGVTTVNAGTLALSASGSLNAASNVSIAAGATLDVSAYATYTLGSSAGLTASGTGTTVGTSAAAIKGGTTVSLGSRPITLTYDGTNPALYVSQGTLSLNGNAFTVNSTSPLAVGTYAIARQASGNITTAGTYPDATGTAMAGGNTGIITVSGGNVILTVSIKVDHFAISTIGSPQTAGTAITGITITAQNARNETVTNFTGTVTFSGTAGVTGTSGVFVGGVSSDSVTPTTAGSGMTLIVTGAGKTGSVTFDVIAGAATSLTASGFPSPQTAGVPGSVTVTAKDAYNNTATGYTGTIQITSSDGAADLPANYTFVPGDNGVHTFTAAVTLKTQGVQSINATDPGVAITGTQSGIIVNPGPVSAGSSTVAATPTSVVANGTSFATITVTLKDAFNNPIPGKTVTLASSRSATDAISAASGLSNANGVVTFAVTSTTPGSAVFTATDATDSVEITQAAAVTFTPASSPAEILTFGLPGYPAVITGTNIAWTVPYGTDVTTLAPVFTLSAGATCTVGGNPAVSGEPRDFTVPVHYIVTSSDTLIINDYTVTVTAAQPVVTSRCGTAEAEQLLLNTVPSFGENRALLEDFTTRYVGDVMNRGAEGLRAGIIMIPVVVHVVYHTPAENILLEQIQSQIAILNKDFRASNSDLSKVPNAFKGVIGDARVEFVLAVRDPNCNPTTGITWTQTDRTSFSMDNSVKYTASGGQDAWPRDKYLNIWVCNLGSDLLGYAYSPGAPAAIDGVVILHSAFGNIGTAAAPSNPYNLGRTATHEIGHWLNLRHIWGDDGCGPYKDQVCSDGSSCLGTDEVADTPNQEIMRWRSPTFPQISCLNDPNGDMFMNYMDYVFDNSMFMFSQGQHERMDACLHAPWPFGRAEILGSDGLIPTGGLPAGPDLWSQDTPEDTGAEPNTVSPYMWISDDIWIRATNDGTAHQDHQNPMYQPSQDPNYVYVRVRNRSCGTSGSGTVKLYWAKASPSIDNWPAPFDGSITSPALMGGLIGSKPTGIIPAGGYVIMEFPWTLPNPADYASFGADKSHFCLVSRIETTSTSPYGMTSPEIVGPYALGVNVKNNNNIVWKNVNVSTGNDRIGWTTLANFGTERTLNRLVFTEPAGEKSVFQWGTVLVHLGDELFMRWDEFGAIGSGIEVVNRDIRLLNSGATIGGLELVPGDLHTISVEFVRSAQSPVGNNVFAVMLTQEQFKQGAYAALGGMKFVMKDQVTAAPVAAAEVWAGTVPGGQWDINTTANWTAGGLPANYTDGDIVEFDDSAPGTTLVQLATTLAPGGVNVNNSTKNYTFTGPGKLTGPTGLTMNGTGILTVLTANDFTGTTTLNAGTLQLGNGGTSGSVTSNLIDNGTLIFNRSDAVTFAGTISGTGSVAKTGTGTLTLTGANTYTGGTTINAGTLQLGDGGTSGSVTSNLIDIGELIFNRSDAVTFAGIISGTGTLTQAGEGTLALTGANTYTGNTAVTSGTLAVTTAHQGAGSFQVGDAVLNVSGPAESTLVMSALILEGGGNATLGFSGLGVTSALITAANLYATGTVTINVADVPGIGEFPLIQYAGTIGGIGFASFQLGGLPPGVVATLADSGASIYLAVTNIACTTPPRVCKDPTLAVSAAGTTNDDFASPEPAQPSTAMVQRLVAAGATRFKGFDDCTVNANFAHTFASLPSRIVDARLRIRLKACGDFCDNDTFGLSFTQSDGTFIMGWGRYLGNGFPASGDLGLFNTPWSVGTVREITLNLADLTYADGTKTNLLPQLNQYGFLDLGMQDDTAIDFAELQLTVCSATPCQDPTLYSAGITTDNFAGPEPAQPSAALAQRLVAAGAIRFKGFDDCTVNANFAHTFANLPSCIVDARLRIRLKACGDFCDNDTFGVGFTLPSGAYMPGWGRYLGNGYPASGGVGLFNTPWNAGTVREITLNLAALPNADGTTTDLLAKLNQYGFLDLGMQDDTAIDFAELQLTSCCCHSDIVVVAPTNGCCAVVDYTPPVFTSPCGPVTVVCTPPPGTCFPIGTTVVTCIGTDRYGQQGRCVFKVTVTDTTPPSITSCPATVIACMGSSNTSGVLPDLTTQVVATDNCTPYPQLTITQNPPAGTIVSGGTVVFTVTDASGNIATCEGTISVQPCCSTPPGGLVLWLPFDERAGPSAMNAVGGNNGTLQNGLAHPFTPQGYVGNSLCFDGMDDVVTVPSYSAIEFTTGDFSLDAWVKRDPASGTTTRVIMEKRSTTTTAGYSLAVSYGNLIMQLADASGYTNYRDTGVVPADNQWHLIAVTISRNLTGGGRFYIDGQPTGTFNPTGHAGTLFNTADFRVGSSPISGNRPWLGCIDEVEVFNRNLTAAEIETVYNSRSAGKCKPRCTVPWDTPIYAGANSTVFTATIYNPNPVPQLYQYSFQGLPVGPHCNFPGPTSFSPATGTVTVPAGGSVSFPVTVDKPVGMPCGYVACYQMIITPAGTTARFSCEGSLVNNCNIFVTPSVPIANLVDCVVVGVGPWMLVNTSAAAIDLTGARFTAWGPDMQPDLRVLSLNGLPPGVPAPVAPGTILPLNGQLQLPLEVQFMTFAPGQAFTLLLEADTDGDGEFEPLASMAVENVIQPTPVLLWSGAVDGNWDTTTANWTADGLPANYAETDWVMFDDSATRTSVNLTTTLSPRSVTVTNSALNYTFTGPGKLTGPTGLTKYGTGVLTILTANDFTGGTIIDGGTLQLGDGGTSGSVTSNLIDNFTLIFNRSDAVTFAGTISGTGTLTKTGSGTLTLTGANTYTGNTTVSAGTLALVNAYLDDASTVTIATGAKLNLTFVGTDTVHKLFIGGVQMPAGTYGATGSGAAHEDDVHFAGPGTLTVTSGAGTSAYDTWAAGYGLTGADALPGADPDHDGIPNSVEMVLGGNPGNVMDAALLPTIELVKDPVGLPAGGYLLFTYRRSDLSVAAGVSADCETDTDLVAPWTPATGAPGVVIQVDDNYASFVPPAAAPTDRVRVYLPSGANPKLFGRLRVTVP